MRGDKELKAQSSALEVGWMYPGYSIVTSCVVGIVHEGASSS